MVSKASEPQMRADIVSFFVLFGTTMVQKNSGESNETARRPVNEAGEITYLVAGPT